VDRLYQLKRNCNACQEKDISLLEGELVALLEDKDPMGSSSRWLVHTGSKFVYLCLNHRLKKKYGQSVCDVTYRFSEEQ